MNRLLSHNFKLSTEKNEVKFHSISMGCGGHSKHACKIDLKK